MLVPEGMLPAHHKIGPPFEGREMEGIMWDLHTCSQTSAEKKE